MSERTRALARAMEILRSQGVFFGIGRVVTRTFVRARDVASTIVWRRRLLRCGSGTQIRYGVQIEYPGNVSIGENCLIQGGVRIGSELPDAKLHIADRVQINGSVQIDHTGGLNIGDDTLISEAVVVYSHSHGLDPHSRPRPLPKTIGRRVWIGARVLVLEGCFEIGEGVIIGAGAVVAKSLPSNSVAYGNPVKIRERSKLE